MQNVYNAEGSSSVTSCKQCPVNTFIGSFGNTNCDACEPGKYTAGEIGAELCRDIPTPAPTPTPPTPPPTPAPTPPPTPAPTPMRVATSFKMSVAGETIGSFTGSKQDKFRNAIAKALFVSVDEVRVCVKSGGGGSDICVPTAPPLNPTTSPTQSPTPTPPPGQGGEVYDDDPCRQIETDKDWGSIDLKKCDDFSDTTNCVVYQRFNSDNRNSGRTCKSFCAKYGLQCTNGWDDTANTCQKNGEVIGCDSDDNMSSDHICSCTTGISRRLSFATHRILVDNAIEVSVTVNSVSDELAKIIEQDVTSAAFSNKVAREANALGLQLDEENLQVDTASIVATADDGTVMRGTPPPAPTPDDVDLGNENVEDGSGDGSGGGGNGVSELMIGSIAGGAVLLLLAGAMYMKRGSTSTSPYASTGGDGGASVLDAAAQANLAAANLRAMRGNNPLPTRSMPRNPSKKFGFKNPMKRTGSGVQQFEFANVSAASPEAAASRAAENARNEAGAAGAVTDYKILPRGWFESVDPTSGNTYYYNDHGDTTWVRPTASIV